MAYLRVYLDNALLEQYEITERSVTIGRTPDNDIILNNPGVSSHHAQIKYENGNYILIDNNSTNGTFVNAKRIEGPHLLVFHEEIQIYNFVLKFMPRPRLEKEKKLKVAAEEVAGETVEVPIPDSKVLKELRKNYGTPYLIEFKQQKEVARYKLMDLVFTIGKDPDADIQLSGWLTPKIAAQIKRERDQLYLIPGKRGKVKLNGIPLKQAKMLKPGDEITVRGREYVFQYQP